ncbi:hypothetical protein BBA70_01980 [New Jersey aster yellows phytoplasma]|uniref:Uncharacterized protein n=1 Tax=New Jersey aster yellows phytoplasma TaxID=270520 RepID=A0ABX4K2H4_9MOLU|nr:hypothetical protein BBA70_01980 [New Jersey aster yellows phytoplasma]
MIPLLFVFLCYYNYFFGSKNKKIKLIKNIKLKLFCYFKTTIKLYHFLKQSFYNYKQLKKIFLAFTKPK